jgi:DNA-binding FadR family transcriptional regulator
MSAESARVEREPYATLRVPKAAELVAKRIRGQIVRGEIAAGDALPTESELMKEFGVSRPTLREALRILESESLISVHRGSRGGARVRVPQIGVASGYAGLLLQFGNTTVVDVLNARQVLEVGAVRMLAENPAKRMVAELRAALVAEEAALDDLEGFRVAATNVHSALVEATGNQTLQMLYAMINDIAQRHGEAVAAAQVAEPRKRPSWRTNSHAVHVQLVDLIEAGDASDAEHLWRSHLRETTRAMSKQVGVKSVLDLFD